MRCAERRIAINLDENLDDMSEEEWNDVHLRWYLLQDVADDLDVDYGLLYAWWNKEADSREYDFRIERVNRIPTVLIHKNSYAQFIEDFQFRSVRNPSLRLAEEHDGTGDNLGDVLW